MKLRFWLLAMDVTSWLSIAADRLHSWAVSRAGAATDWGAVEDCSGGSGEEPF